MSSAISDQTSYLICVFNDSSIHVFNSSLEDIGQITLTNNDNELCQPQPCLTFQQVSGAASNDVICPVNQGEGSYKKAFKGAPLHVLSCGDYLVVGYAGGYVCVVSLKQWL